MTEVTTENIENKDSDATIAIFLVFALIVMNEKGYTAKWKDYSEKIKDGKSVENHDILNVINELKDECTALIAPNTIFFRARSFNDEQAERLTQREIWDDLKEALSLGIFCENPATFGSSSWSNFAQSLSAANVDVRKILTDWMNKHEHIKFWGFDRQESGVNKTSDSSEGRLNAKGQHHLYLAEDIDTAIYEMRAINEQLVNVATVKVIKEIKLFDLCKEFNASDAEEAVKYFKLNPMARISSKPNYGDDNYYKPTQLLSDHIKKLGFEGIRYPSSLKKDGKNILIFDDFNIEYEDDPIKATLQILDSSVYKVTETKILFDKCFPIELQEQDDTTQAP